MDVSGQLFPILVKDTLFMDIFLPEISQCLCRGFIMIYLVLPAFRDNLFVQNHVYKLFIYAFPISNSELISE